jgi:hypothetical protein
MCNDEREVVSSNASTAISQKAPEKRHELGAGSAWN